MRRAIVCLLAIVASTLIAPAAESARARATSPVVAPFDQLNDLFHAYGDGGADWRPGDPRTWTGGDSTFSTRLPDGRDVWMFSDSFLSPSGDDHTRDGTAPFVNNSFMLQNGTAIERTLYGGTPQAPTTLIRPPAPNNPRSFYWMGDATVEHDKLRVFVHRYPIIFTLPPSAEATAIATFSLPDMTLESIDEGFGLDGETDPWAFLFPGAHSPVPITWGAGLLEDGGYTYVYGTEEYPLAKHLHVARAPAGALTTAPWQYFDGSTWTHDPLKSARIASDVAGELSVVATDTGYRLIASELGIGDIMMRTAPKPEGPWGSKTNLYHPPELARGAFVYNAHEHPQFNTPGTIVLSYNVNGSLDGNDIYEDVHVYRPRFIQVTL